MTILVQPAYIAGNDKVAHNSKLVHHPCFIEILKKNHQTKNKFEIYSKKLSFHLIKNEIHCIYFEL